MTPELERTLRIITIGSSAIAFPLVIAAGVISENISIYSWQRNWAQKNPVPILIGLIPMFASVIATLFFLRASIKDEAKKYMRYIWILADTLIFGGYLAVLVPVWIYEPKHLDNHANWMLLEGYASVPLLVNLCIHGFLILSKTGIVKFIQFLLSGREEKTCPHCHHAIGGGRVMATKGAGPGYSLLRGEDYDEDAPGASEPRPSQDSLIAADV